MIELCHAIFAENLSLIYNNAIEIGKYPMALKVAKVIALFKKYDMYQPYSNNIFIIVTCDKVTYTKW